MDSELNISTCARCGLRLPAGGTTRLDAMHSARDKGWLVIGPTMICNTCQRDIDETNPSRELVCVQRVAEIDRHDNCSGCGVQSGFRHRSGCPEMGWP